MNGFLLIDKPSGVTSFDCVRKLRRVCSVRRMGFIGTLDPLATGLMIYAIGEATKLIPYLEGMDKVYDVMIKLGAESNTYDAEGDITEVELGKGWEKPSRAEIEGIMEDDFLGEREQVPPAFSAIHIDGKRAYDLARKGDKVKLKSRKVNFYDLVVKSYKWPNLRIVVHCGSGTYIRSFAHDLGRILGCRGYVKDLRRTKIGGYSIKNAVKLEDIDELNYKKHLILPQEFFKDWTQIDLNDEDYKILANGGFLENRGGIKKSPILALFEGQCAGVLEIHKGELKFARKFNI